MSGHGLKLKIAEQEKPMSQVQSEQSQTEKQMQSVKQQLARWKQRWKLMARLVVIQEKTARLVPRPE